MSKFSTSNFFNKRFLGFLISALGIGFFLLTTVSNGALLPNIPNLTKTANLGTEAGENAVFVPPYSIGKIQADNSKYMYFINFAEATAFVPSTRTGAGVNFSCDNTNHVSQKLVSTERRRAILNKIINNQQGGLTSWMSITDSSQSPSGQTGEAFWQGILNNATSFFNPAPAGNTGVSADSTINGTIINKIKQAMQQLGLSSPGLVMACGCANITKDQNDKALNPAFPPYRQETYRTTLNPSDLACEARQATCNPTNGKFDNITTTGTRYRGACALPPQMTETGSCVLKRFLYGVMNNHITYSKIRAAMTGASIKDTENTLPYAYKYPMGYGQLKNVHYGSNGYRKLPFPNPSYQSLETGILTNVMLFENYPGSSDNVAEFSLLGITPQTEGTNRGCLPDGTGYRVNSKVYSKQLVAKGFQHDIAGSVYMGGPNYYDGYMQHYSLFSSSQPKDISFAERDRNLDYRGDTRLVRNDVNTHSYPYKTYTYGVPDYEGNYQMTNKLYGCQAELLPGPDLYCVERVVRTGANANTLYFKEFTKEYAGDKTCSSLSLFTTTGATRSFLNKEDAGYGANTRDTTHIIFSSTEYLPGPGGGPTQLMNGIFNATPEYQPATNIFGTPLKNNSAVESYTFGINATQATHGVKIPLKDGQYSLYEIEGNNAQNKRSVVAKNAMEARAEICKQITGQPCSSNEISSVIFQTAGTAISTDANFIQKNVCYASKPCEIIDPNGKNSVVLNGRAGTFYSVSTAPDDHLCSEYAQIKTCSNGAPLTGYTTCKDSLFTIVITKIEQIVESILP